MNLLFTIFFYVFWIITIKKYQLFLLVQCGQQRQPVCSGHEEYEVDSILLFLQDQCRLHWRQGTAPSDRAGATPVPGGFQSSLLEKKKRAEVLKRNQQKVLEANKAFLAGNQSWRERINEFNHLTEQEFLHSLTVQAPENDTIDHWDERTPRQIW